MNKNIRRHLGSIVIAAGATGAWALGSTVAGAYELPASGVTVRDVSVDTADITDTVTDAAGTVDETVSDFTGTGTGTGPGTGATADVAPFAYGVVGEAAPLAERVGPFAQDLTGTVGGTAGPPAGDAVTGVEGVADSVTPGYVPRGL
ncbi:hypothetical protein JIX56_16675 [Streptomyces sp. CA-210063]|uniref:hypothetical protein n=1 Tax=Streptomyces sp. CA-210063 TaxID=2801029 RepID=UPI00214CC835|nr:hypothetical protein [Streptomyces sp. CA-210063]UUU31407.1 hypothetical protein JIX56_16675 [Streptomyces sp. CA-210063]